MAIDRSVPLVLSKEDPIPACDQSIALAHEFLESCLNDTGSRSDLISLCIAMDFKFARYAEHRAHCPHCRSSAQPGK